MVAPLNLNTGFYKELFDFLCVLIIKLINFNNIKRLVNEWINVLSV